MEWTYPTLLLLGLPLGGSLLPVVSWRRGNRLAHAISLVVLAVAAIFTLFLLNDVLSNGPSTIEVVPGFVLNLDFLAVIMAVLSTCLCFACVLASVSYGVFKANGVRYLSSILVLCAALNGIFLSGDLVLMLFFWEMMVVSTYLVVIHSGRDAAVNAGRKYFVMSQVGAVFILASIAVAAVETGTTRMVPGSILYGSVSGLAFALFAFIGFGIDAALVPFHVWLPDAHSESPTPMSALLSGIVVKTGIYGLIRFFYLLYQIPGGWVEIVIPLGLVTALVGVFLALFQMDGKRLIAMHTISQVGLIIMGLGTGTVSGATGSIFHLLNHSIFKSLLFLTAGWVMWSSGTRDLDTINRTREARRLLPFYLIGLLSISGIPPFSGFFSKSLIGKSVYANSPNLAIFSSLVGMLTLLSFMKLGWFLFFRGDGRSTGEIPSAAVTGVCAVLAAICIAQGVFSSQVIGIIDKGVYGADSVTVVPSPLSTSILTLLGYLSSLVALAIWLRKEFVYKIFTEGSLRFFGILGKKELFVDGFYLSISRAVVRSSRATSLLASGKQRDYIAYVIVAWLVGILLILGGIL